MQPRDKRATSRATGCTRTNSEAARTYVESDEGALPLPDVHRDLALHMSTSNVVDARQLHVLTIAFRLGAIFLIGEVIAWVVDISTGP